MHESIVEQFQLPTDVYPEKSKARDLSQDARRDEEYAHMQPHCFCPGLSLCFGVPSDDIKKQKPQQ